MKMEKENVLVYEYSFNLTNILKEPWGLPGPHFKNHCLKQTNIVYSFPGVEKHYVRSHTEIKAQT